VEIRDPQSMLKWALLQQSDVLHELALAYYDRHAAKEDSELSKKIQAAYEQAKADGQYKSVLRFDGQRQYQTEGMSGLTWKTMLAAAATNAAIKTRTDFYLHRVPEEFYDLTNDRYERTNLIGDPTRQAEIEAMRKELLALMQRTGDPFTEAFAHREDKALAAAVITKLKREYSKISKPQGEAEK
jgi:ABC-type Fe3+ transport system substrate-binding protein